MTEPRTKSTVDENRPLVFRPPKLDGEKPKNKKAKDNGDKSKNANKEKTKATKAPAQQDKNKTKPLRKSKSVEDGKNNNKNVNDPTRGMMESRWWMMDKCRKEQREHKTESRTEKGSFSRPPRGKTKARPQVSGFI